MLYKSEKTKQTHKATCYNICFCCCCPVIWLQWSHFYVFHWDSPISKGMIAHKYYVKMKGSNIQVYLTWKCFCESVRSLSSIWSLSFSVKVLRLKTITSVSLHTTSSLRAWWMNSYWAWVVVKCHVMAFNVGAKLIKHMYNNKSGSTQAFHTCVHTRVCTMCIRCVRRFLTHW